MMRKVLTTLSMTAMFAIAGSGAALASQGPHHVPLPGDACNGGTSTAWSYSDNYAVPAYMGECMTMPGYAGH